MIHSTRKRLPFLATGLAVAIGFMSAAQGEDKSPLTPSDKTTTSSSSSAKQVTLTGKVVNLHQHMTGQMSSSSSTDRPGSSIDRPGTSPSDRTNPSSATKPGDSTITPSDRTQTGDKSHYSDKNHKSSAMNNEVMGLETSTGLVLICFKDAPSVLATPNDNDAPTTTPGNPVLPTEPRTPKTPSTPNTTITPSTPNTSDSSNSSRNQDSARWQDKQVEVTGAMYEKNGIKFLVVTKVTAADSSKTSPSTSPSTTTPRQ